MPVCFFDTAVDCADRSRCCVAVCTCIHPARSCTIRVFMCVLGWAGGWAGFESAAQPTTQSALSVLTTLCLHQVVCFFNVVGTMGSPCTAVLACSIAIPTENVGPLCNASKLFCTHPDCWRSHVRAIQRQALVLCVCRPGHPVHHVWSLIYTDLPWLQPHLFVASTVVKKVVARGTEKMQSCWKKTPGAVRHSSLAGAGSSVGIPSVRFACVVVALQRAVVALV